MFTQLTLIPYPHQVTHVMISYLDIMDNVQLFINTVLARTLNMITSLKTIYTTTRSRVMVILSYNHERRYFVSVQQPFP